MTVELASKPSQEWLSAEAALLDLSALSGLLRAYKAGEKHARSLPLYLSFSPAATDSSSLVPVSQDQMLELIRCVRRGMAQLARFMRETGQDARDRTGWWDLLEEQDAYVEPFERNRRVDVDELTPLAIYTCMSRANKLVWQGWIVYLGGSREVTDDYGMPAWESRIWVCSPDDTLVMFSGVKKETAREIYRHIVGKPFDGIDELGFDPPHPAENGSWWDDVEV